MPRTDKKGSRARGGRAGLSSYHPAVDSDWSEEIPRTEQQALDILAARSPVLTYIAANGVTLNTGGDGGDVSDLQTMLDGNVYHIDEVTGAPGMDLEIDFTGVTRIDRIVVRAHYDGGPPTSHAVRIQLWNYDSEVWDTIHTMTTSEDFQSHFKTIPDGTNYISGGAAIVRFYHTETGNINHDLYVDYCALAFLTEAFGGGIDTDAIHDNVSGEIAAITQKATPVDADLVVIEDSEDGNNKKRVELGDLPGGGGGLANIVEDLSPQLGADLDTGDNTIENSSGDGHLRFKLGDNAGANELKVRDSDDVEIFVLDSDGKLTLGRGLKLGGNLDLNNFFIRNGAGSGSVVIKLGNTDGTSSLSILNSSSIPVMALTDNGNIGLAGLLDGRDVAADGTKLDTIATNANNYSHPDHTGDVTSSGDGATAIAAEAVTNAKLAHMAQSTIKGRAAAAGTGDATDLSVAQMLTILGLSNALKRSEIFYIQNPGSSDVFPLFSPSTPITITAVRAWTDTGTVTFNLENRATNPFTATGEEVVTTDVIATTSGDEETAFNGTRNEVAAKGWVTILKQATSGTPLELAVAIDYTINA